jgi:hypothetical protein
MLARFDSWQDLALGSSVALEFVGDDHARDVGPSLEQLAEELLGGALIPAALHQDIQHIAVLIHGPPEIMPLARDRETHLIHMPLVSEPRASTTKLIRILLTKLATPLANRLIGRNHTSLKRELFHIPEAQAKSEVVPHGVADDLYRKAVVLIVRGA